MNEDELQQQNELAQKSADYKKLFDEVSIYLDFEEKKEDVELNEEGYVDNDVQLTSMVVAGNENGELEMPSMDKMKGDFASLAQLAQSLQDGGVALPLMTWIPLKHLVENYVSSNVAPREIEDKWNVLKPLYELFKKNESYLMQPEVGVIGTGVDTWIAGVDRRIGEYLNGLKKEQ